MPPVKTKTSQGNETVDETVKRAKALIAPEVTASELVNPPQQAPVTPVPQQQLPQGLDGRINNVSGFIRSQSENARRLQEEQQAFRQFANESSGFDLQQQMLNQFGVTPEKLNRLQDIQLQLANRNTQSEITKSRITGAEGQTLNQAGREITQEDRERAIRDAGLASEAAVLSGNIETGRALARDAVTVALADRQFLANAQLQAIADLKDVVDEETRQLLEQEERGYQAEQARIEELKTNIAEAMVSGATQEEVRMMTNPNLSDEQKLQMAQSIVARGASEERNLRLESQRLENAKNVEQLKQLRQPKEATRSTQVIDNNGVKQLVDTQTGEVIATFNSGETTNEIEVARDTAFVNNIDLLKTHSGLNSSVGPLGITRMAVGDVAGAKDEFIGSVENIVKTLTLNTFADAKAKGMTFGAMSQGEWDILGQSASKIVQWREKDDDGNVVGYDVSEKAFKKELDALSNFGKLDALRKGANPAEIGVQVMEDGSVWTRNSDGTLTNLSEI